MLENPREWHDVCRKIERLIEEWEAASGRHVRALGLEHNEDSVTVYLEDEPRDAPDTPDNTPPRVSD